MRRLAPLLWAIFCASPLLAGEFQNPGDYQGEPDRGPGRTQATADVAALSSENALRLPPIENALASYETNELSLEAAADPGGGKADDKDTYFTLDELKKEMKKLAWTKGDMKIVPYGILWGGMAYETSPTNTGDYVYYVVSRSVDEDQLFHVDGRSTRFGVDVTGPKIPFFDCAQSGGKIEFDFQGAGAPTENRGTVLLRHAYVEVKDDDFRLLFGQTWDVISPLYPGLMMYSVGWGGGNIGYRRAQLRGEHYYHCSDTLMFTAQGSLDQDLFTPGDLTGTTIRADHSGWPILEGRVAATLGERGPGCQPVVMGLSAHIGEQTYAFLGGGGLPAVKDFPIKTWSLNTDLRIPLNERLGFQGEFFVGENLGPYLGGIIQGINPVTRKPIRSIGGWGEVYYYWTPECHSHSGYSIDDPFDVDVPAGGRTYNSFYFTNLCYDFTKQFTVGLELTYWQTIYAAPLLPGDAVHIEFAAKYAF